MNRSNSNSLLFKRRRDILYLPDWRPQPDNEIWYKTLDGTAIPSANTYYSTAITPYVTGNTIIASTYGNPDGRLIYNRAVTSINNNAFRGNGKITEVSIPSKVATIPNGNIGIGCTALTDYKVSANNQYYRDVDGVLFTKDMTTLVAYPRGKTATSYTIPNGVTTIGANAFYGNTYLTSVTIPDGVTTINGAAFYACNKITAMVIPTGVTTIGNSAFANCSKMASIDLPDTLTSIGNSAFQSCTSLTAITVQDGISTIGSSAFYGCTKLKTVVIGEGLVTLNGYTFYNCTALRNLTLPNSLRTLGSSAIFAGCINCHFVLPEGVTTIAYAALNGTGGNFRITIPSTVTSISDQIQVGSSNQAYIYVATGNTNFVSTNNGCFLWQINTQGQKTRLLFGSYYYSGSFLIPDTVKSFDSYCCEYSSARYNPIILGYGMNNSPGGYAFKRFGGTLKIRRTTGLVTYSDPRQSTPSRIEVPEHLLDRYKAASGWSARNVVSYNPFSSSAYAILTDGTYATNSSQFQKIWVCGFDNPVTTDYPDGALAAIEACTGATEMYDIAIACGY